MSYEEKVSELKTRRWRTYFMIAVMTTGCLIVLGQDYPPRVAPPVASDYSNHIIVPIPQFSKAPNHHTDGYARDLMNDPTIAPGASGPQWAFQWPNVPDTLYESDPVASDPVILQYSEPEPAPDSNFDLYLRDDGLSLDIVSEWRID
jgi:hypothetical protein